MLNHMPLEILHLILDALPSWRDSQAVSRVCRYLRSVTVPRLYETVTFSAISEWTLNSLNVRRFWECHAPQALGNLRNTRQLQFVAPIHFARSNRCAYRSILRSESMIHPDQDATESTLHSNFLYDLKEQIYGVFMCLSPSTLYSFSWHLGTCLPSGVLDEAGYIATHQNQIQALSLITDGTCVDADVGLDGLAKLNQLRHVSWDGLYEARALPPLAQCLDRNRNHLRSLRLGFCELYDCHENCQAMSSVLLDRLQQGLPKGAVKFPLLDALSLSNAAFLAKKELALTVLNIANLRSLTLRDCSFQLEFLESLATLRPGVRLTHFGICFDEFREPDLLLDTHPVLDFLVSFAGLESLHVLISNSFRPGDWFARPVEHHRASLKRLVHHERSLMPLDGRAIFEETRDIPTSWISQIDHALDSSVVRALGLCLSPSVAQSCLTAWARDSPLLALHLRSSGAENLPFRFRQAVLSQLEARMSDATFPTLRDRTRVCVIEPNDPSEDSIDDCSTCSTVVTVENLDCTTDSEPDIGAQEFLNFADWAFGPNGFRCLQILAYGDFSYGGRYHHQSIMLCRATHLESADSKSFDLHQRKESTPLFEILDDLHSGTVDSPEDIMEFLAACPVDDLIEHPGGF